MYRLLKEIACHRYDRAEDSNSIKRHAEDEFERVAREKIKRAFPTLDEQNDFDEEICALIHAIETACYLDGIRDTIGLLSYQGTLDELYGGGAL